MSALNWLTGFRGKSWIFFPKGPMLNIRSAQKTNFVEVHSRTIHSMFALNWFTGARAENFQTFFPIRSYVKTMSADSGHLEFPIGKKNITFVEVHPMTIYMQCLLWTGLLVSEKKFLKHFPIGSHVKTMSADGGHLEFPIGTKNITFVEVHPMTIHAMFALNRFTGFRGEIF